MKIAYFDCPSGLSGNMILGALIDAGLEFAYLKKQLRYLQLTAYSLQLSKKKKHHLAGTYFNVKTKESKNRRNLNDILKIIRQSRLSKQVKTLSSKIFRRLAQAEAKVHGIPVGKVHFHEVGAVDAIIDIVGSCIGFEKLGIKKIYCSPLPSGKGKIVHVHGLLPNPSPAAAELLKGFSTYGAGIQGELVTPTGAAIITTLAENSDPPRMKFEAIGYGAGSIDLPIPNLLRIFIGEAELPTEHDTILQIETNIDDMGPKAFPKVITKLMKTGALDASVRPILMKKNRQGFLLTVICQPELRERILDRLFMLTTTFGARVYVVPRETLSRKLVAVKTKYGKVKVKLGLLGKEIKTIAPEFEELKKLADKYCVPIQALSKRALKKSAQSMSSLRPLSGE